MRLVSWDNAKPGDFVTFNWDGGVPDHIGMLVERYPDSAKCVEGNTSPTNGPGMSQSNGGGMYVRHRDRSQIQAIIRWT
jgi:cell wall-associated NlpC family hydrolase